MRSKVDVTFKWGGIHPGDSKTATKDKPIVVLQPPGTITLPLIQHIGAPCTPLVEVGENVLMGQKIAESEAPVSAPIHASVSGKVKKIEPRPHPNGTFVMSVVLENDYKDTMSEQIAPKDELINLTSKDLINIVREAGIVGLGGAGFPTHIKLSPPEKKLSTAIINGAECEPYLTSDHRVMIEQPKKVLDGLRIIMKATGAKTGIVAIESNKPDAITAMKKIVKRDKRIRVMTLKTKYPQGSEKHLIKAVIGKEVPSGGLPSAVGVVVNNVDTAVAISEAVLQGIPLMSRVITVSGECVANPCNFLVRIGTSFEYVLGKAGGFASTPQKILMGGPMMGIAQHTLDVPVIKGTSGIIALPHRAYEQERNCIRCGKCAAHCPMRLMPFMIAGYSERKDIDNIKRYNILDCIECGCCSYMCPAGRFLTQTIKDAKSLARNAVTKG